MTARRTARPTGRPTLGKHGEAAFSGGRLALVEPDDDFVCIGFQFVIMAKKVVRLLFLTRVDWETKSRRTFIRIHGTIFQSQWETPTRVADSGHFIQYNIAV